MTDLSTMTPVEIDTELARLDNLWWDAVLRANSTYQHVETEVARHLGRGWRGEASEAEIIDFVNNVGTCPASLIASWNRIEDYRHEAQVAREQMRPYEEQYYERRWTRAFLVVTNGTGHVHRSKGCSTCYPTTRYCWMVEYSGKDEAEIIEAAGERACTVCYPSAPVGMTGTRMFTPDEVEAQRRREERAAAKAKRDAAKITLSVWVSAYAPDYRTTKQKVLAVKEVTWKTTRALQNDTGALIRRMEGAYAMVNGFDLDTQAWVDGEYVTINQDLATTNLAVMLAALEERGVDVDALVRKNTARAQKER